MKKKKRNRVRRYKIQDNVSHRKYMMSIFFTGKTGKTVGL